MSEAISDERVVRVLSRYAALAARLLAEPESWAEEDAGAAAGVLGRAGRSVRARFTGTVHPGSEQWDALPLQTRVDWWVDRVAGIAAPVAATPRIFGILADRLPLQAAFGAAAQGLAICAAAQEHGERDPDAWVPLLGMVLLGRQLPRGSAAEAAAAEEDEAPPPAADAVDEGALRIGARAIWRLARGLLALYGLFDARPRGAWAFRALGKVPVVGLLGGVLDERGGVRRAAEETLELLGPSRPS